MIGYFVGLFLGIIVCFGTEATVAYFVWKKYLSGIDIKKITGAVEKIETIVNKIPNFLK